MVNVAWPAELKPISGGFSYENFDRSGGAALGGGEQFVFSPGARWVANMKFPIVDDAGVLTIRALRTKLQGRANAAILPAFDGRRANWPIEAATSRVLTPRTAHKIAGTYGLEGTAYAGPEIPTSAAINATVASPAPALGATTIAITVTQGAAIQAGQQFGIANRLYEIASVDTVVGSTSTVTFKPPLRAAATVGTTVQFTRPTCLMRCMNLDEQTRSFEGLIFATLDLQFVEYF